MIKKRQLAAYFCLNDGHYSTYFLITGSETVKGDSTAPLFLHSHGDKPASLGTRSRQFHSDGI